MNIQNYLFLFFRCVSCSFDFLFSCKIVRGSVLAGQQRQSVIPCKQVRCRGLFFVMEYLSDKLFSKFNQFNQIIQIIFIFLHHEKYTEIIFKPHENNIFFL